eukprot:2901672-Heterocapsa_arctica.AAC.1
MESFCSHIKAIESFCSQAFSRQSKTILMFYCALLRYPVNNGESLCSPVLSCVLPSIMNSPCVLPSITQTPCALP